MEHIMNVTEEVASILDRLKKGAIRPEFAKSELHYMIKASETTEELNLAYHAYSQVGQQKA